MPIWQTESKQTNLPSNLLTYQSINPLVCSLNKNKKDPKFNNPINDFVSQSMIAIKKEENISVPEWINPPSDRIESTIFVDGI